MRRKRIIYKGEPLEIVEFETAVDVTAPKEKQLEQIERLIQEDEDTKSGKRPIKPIDKRRKPEVIG